MKVHEPKKHDAQKAIGEIRDQVLSRAHRVFSGNYDDLSVRTKVLSSANHYAAQLTSLLTKQGAPPRVRRRAIFQILRGFDARLCAHILSCKGEPITLEDACKLAREIDPRKDCGEPIRFYERKKPDGGFRPIWNFGPKRRALQRLVTDVLRVLWGPPTLNYASKGRGRDAALEKLVEHTIKKGGARWYLTADVTECFGSFDQEKLVQIIPLPEMVVRYSILVPQETIIHTDHHENTSSKAVLQGLPQGSLASFYIATKLLEPVLLQLQGEVVVAYADDIAVGCKTQKEAEANELLLGDLLHDHPAGPLFMKSSVAKLGSPIDYLGYRFRRRWSQYGGGVRLTPSPKAFIRYQQRLATKLRAAPTGQFDELAAGYMRDWRSANRLWDRSDAGDVLLDVTTWHVLSEVRWEKIKHKAAASLITKTSGS